MAVSGAIHPQLLSVVGSGAHYRGLLPALTATERSSSELTSSCGWLDVWSLQWLTAEAAPPLSWQTAAAEERPLSERWLVMWGVQGCWQSYTQLLYFPFPSLLNPFTSLCYLHVFLHAGRPQRGGGGGGGAENEGCERAWRKLNAGHMSRRHGGLIKGIGLHFGK